MKFSRKTLGRVYTCILKAHLNEVQVFVWNVGDVSVFLVSIKEECADNRSVDCSVVKVVIARQVHHLQLDV